MFELTREKNKISGGGLAIGVIHDLKPVMTRKGDDEVECLSVEITVGQLQILCVVGYGPQLGDSDERKEQFWKYLEEEIISADIRNVGIIIQIDSN